MCVPAIIPALIGGVFSLLGAREQSKAAQASINAQNVRPAPINTYVPPDNANNGSQSITITTPDPALQEPTVAGPADGGRTSGSGGKQGLTITPNKRRALGISGVGGAVSGGGVNVPV